MAHQLYLHVRILVILFEIIRSYRYVTEDRQTLARWTDRWLEFNRALLTYKPWRKQTVYHIAINIIKQSLTRATTCPDAFNQEHTCTHIDYLLVTVLVCCYTVL